MGYLDPLGKCAELQAQTLEVCKLHLNQHHMSQNLSPLRGVMYIGVILGLDRFRVSCLGFIRFEA